MINNLYVHVINAQGDQARVKTCISYITYKGTLQFFYEVWMCYYYCCWVSVYSYWKTGLNSEQNQHL